jgi:hypothetical protein
VDDDDVCDVDTRGEVDDGDDDDADGVDVCSRVVVGLATSDAYEPKKKRCSGRRTRCMCSIVCV